MGSHGKPSGRKKKIGGIVTEHFYVTVGSVNKNKNVLVSNLFNDFYVNLGKELASAVPAGVSEVDDTVCAMGADFRLLRSTTWRPAWISWSAPGLDNIPANVIKDNYYLLKVLLLRVINNRIKHSVFPDTFKVVKVTPIYEGGERESALSPNIPPKRGQEITRKVHEKAIGII